MLKGIRDRKVWDPHAWNWPLSSCAIRCRVDTAEVVLQQAGLVVAPFQDALNGEGAIGKILRCRFLIECHSRGQNSLSRLFCLWVIHIFYPHYKLRGVNV